MTNVFAAVISAVPSAGGAGGEEMPSVLAVPIDELIIGIIAFLIVFGVLGKLALPAIKKTLAERTELIEGGLAKADETQARRSAFSRSTRQHLPRLVRKQQRFAPRLRLIALPSSRRLVMRLARQRQRSRQQPRPRSWPSATRPPRR